MGHFNVKFFLLVVIYLLCPVCTQELMKTCGIVPTKVKIFECDQMFMSDINRNLTKLASMVSWSFLDFDSHRLFHSNYK